MNKRITKKINKRKDKAERIEYFNSYEFRNRIKIAAHSSFWMVTTFIDTHIWFTLNNWDSTFYPDKEPVSEWIKNLNEYFGSDKYCKDNNLFVVMATIDQSIDFSIIAERKWVEENCPFIIDSEFDMKYTYEDYKYGKKATNNFGTPFFPVINHGNGIKGGVWYFENDIWKSPSTKRKGLKQYMAYLPKWGGMLYGKRIRFDPVKMKFNQKDINCGITYEVK